MNDCKGYTCRIVCSKEMKEYLNNEVRKIVLHHHPDLINSVVSEDKLLRYALSYYVRS